MHANSALAAKNLKLGHPFYQEPNFRGCETIITDQPAPLTDAAVRYPPRFHCMLSNRVRQEPLMHPKPLKTKLQPSEGAGLPVITLSASRFPIPETSSDPRTRVG